MTGTDPLAPRVVRRAHAGRSEWAPAPPHRVFRLFDELLGPIGSGVRFGSELAIDSTRFAECLHGVPAAERLPRQPRERT